MCQCVEAKAEAAHELTEGSDLSVRVESDEQRKVLEREANVRRVGQVDDFDTWWYIVTIALLILYIN